MYRKGAGATWVEKYDLRQGLARTWTREKNEDMPGGRSGTGKGCGPGEGQQVVSLTEQVMRDKVGELG